jgi:hypothetical protein
MPIAFRPFLEHESDCRGAQCFQQQHDMRIADECREAPIRPGEAGERAGKNQPPVDPHGVKHGLPDRLRQVALDEILEPQEIVARPGLPVGRLGLDGPGGDLVVGCDLWAADGGVHMVEPAEFPQFGAEHAVVLRQPARIVPLNIDDMAVANAQTKCPQVRPGL